MSHVFVYGTLLRSYRNPRTKEVESHPRHSILEGFHHKQGYIQDYALYWPPDLGFPFISFFAEGRVFGELYYDVDQLEKLDAVEGVLSGLFERKTVTVHVENGIELAFVYVGGPTLSAAYSNGERYEDLTASGDAEGSKSQ